MSLGQAEVWARVIEKPDDDDARLAYADWCERCGDLARAEFIRLGVQWAREVRSGTFKQSDAAYNAIQLAFKHGDEWAGPIRQQVRDVHFSRGFVEHVTVDAATFLEKAPEFYALAPIRRLTLLEPAPVLAQLCASPHLDRIISLDLKPFKVRFDDEGFRQIYSSSHMQRLVHLGLVGSLVTEAGVEALAASGALPNLRSLDLRATPAKALAEYVEDDAGLIIDAFGSPGAAAIDAKYGRKTWLHTVEDNQRRWLDPTGF